MVKAKEQPWKLHLDPPGQGLISKEYIIPTALGVTSAKDSSFLGIISIGINIHGLSKKIATSLASSDTIFILLNSNMQPIGYSDHHMLLIPGEKWQGLKHQFSKASGYITKQDGVEGIKFFYYKKIDHDLVILVGKSEDLINSELTRLLITTIKFPLLIFAGFLVILYIFSHTVLAPFRSLSEVAFNIARGRPTGVIPTFYNIEALNLSKALMLVHQSLKREQDSRRELVKAQQELLNLNSQLEQKVQQRTAELEKSLQINTNFLNNISHEVRIPIQGITALSRGLVDNWDNFDAATQYHLAMKIANNSGRLFNLVSHLLDLSKLTDTNSALHEEYCDLVELIKEVIEECNSLYLMDNKITIEFISPLKLELLLDANKITQVLRNLLSNAMKAMPEGGKIIVQATKLAEQVCITVKDQGIGIPENELEDIFAPFVQSNNIAQKGGGVGLGLAIVKAIIKAHNGTITAANNPQGGAVFTFILPLTPKTTLPVNAATSLPSPRQTSTANIVFVDDETTCLLSIEMLLRNTAYKLYTFDRALKALEFIQSNHSIDIIMLDMMMPEMSGLELLKILKNNDQLKHIPIIIQSGIADEQEIDEARLVGIAHFMSKPYNKEEIIRVIEQILAKKP